MKKLKLLLSVFLSALVLSTLGAISIMAGPQFTVKLQSDIPNNTVGSSVKFTADVIGTYADYKYKFVCSYNNGESWNILSNFNALNTVSFTPTKPGSYQLYVDVADSQGNIVTTATAFTMKLGWTSNLSNSVSSARVGQRIPFQVNTTGNNSANSLTYKYVWSCNNWQSWGVIRNFSSIDKANFTPTKAGIYDIYLDTKDKYGNVVTTSKRINVSLGWSITQSVSASSTTIGLPINTNTLVNNDGDNFKYNYKFVWSRNNWTDWGIINKSSTVSSVSFTPTKPGNYQFYVDVSDNYGNVVTQFKTVSVVQGWSINHSISVPSNKIGTNISASAGIVNPNKHQTYRYKFVWSRNNWSDWGVISNSSSKSSVNFKPTNNGNYTIYIDVIDNFGNVITKSKAFTIVSSWQALTPTISMANNIPGSKVAITANTSGTLSGTKYKFVYSYNYGEEWGVISNFTSSRTVNFYPNKVGHYDIYTDVMDSAGSINTKNTSFSIRAISYKLVVNLSTQTVSALVQNADGSYGASIRNMPCSTGKVSGTTPTGTFPLKTKYRWHALNGGVWGQWCSRIVGGILFHSIPYRSKNNKTLITKYYNQLGSPASAGCIRLRAVDVKWIYDNCPEGTPVQIGSLNWPTLPNKISARRIKSSTTWDPTDPSLNSTYYDKGWL